MGTKMLLVTALALLIVGPLHAGVFTISLYRFSGERPDIPFEATTFEQDDLWEAARMRRDNKELESTAACAALIADETAPFELRAWAVRKKMTLDIYAQRCREAVRTGRDWLREYGDVDPHALDIRRVMTHAMVRRCGHYTIFQFDIDEVHALFEEIFANHPPDNRYVINARYRYAKALERLAALDPSLRFEAAKQYETTAVAVLDFMAGAEYQQATAHVQQLFNVLLTKARYDMATVLSNSWAPRPLPSEEEIFRKQGISYSENDSQIDDNTESAE